MMSTSDVTSSPNELLSDQYQAWSDSMNHVPSMALRCALELRIPDIIGKHHGPVTLAELVTQLSIPPAKSSHLRVIMQLLVHLGYFSIQQMKGQDQQGYALTSLSELFVSSNHHHLSLSPFSLFMSDPVHQKPCYFMADWFRSSHSSAFEIAHGIGPMEYLEKHPDFSTHSNEANASSSKFEMKWLLKDLIPKLEGFESLVDVGGGTGMVANIISEAAPHLKCTVFDLPAVISQAIHTNSNITFLGGNMLELIPCADIVFFKATLASFNDEDCLKILRKCREAIKGGGKMIMVEIVKDQEKTTLEATKLQLCYEVMIMSCGGADRNEIQWKKLFLDAGFTSYTITPTSTLSSIIEVFP